MEISRVYFCRNLPKIAALTQTHEAFTAERAEIAKNF